MKNRSLDHLPKEFRKLLGIKKHLGGSIKENKRVLERFPFLWSVRNCWFLLAVNYFEVHDLTSTDIRLKCFISSFFRLFGSYGFCEVWIHEVGSMYESCHCLNSTKKISSETVEQAFRKALTSITGNSQIRHVIVSGNNAENMVIFRIKPRKKWRTILEKAFGA